MIFSIIIGLLGISLVLSLDFWVNYLVSFASEDGKIELDKSLLDMVEMYKGLRVVITIGGCSLFGIMIGVAVLFFVLF
jgi:hypothetical protein